MGSRRRGAILPPVALSVIALVVTAMMTVPVFSQSATAIAIRDIEKQTLAPGGSTNVTVTITNNVAQPLSLDEDIPEGWSLTRVSDDADAYKPSTNKWVWFSVGAGETKTVIYRLTVPDNASEGDYSIVGRISNASGVIDAVKGDDIITVEVPPTPKSASAVRDIEKQTLAPGESTNVTVIITNNVSQPLSLDEDIPEGWSLTRVSDDADAYKPSTNEWVWFSVGAGETKTVIYRLTVPDNASEGDYSIVGRISNASGVIDAVKGDDIITVVQDITPPEIDFVEPPTPPNNSEVTVNYVNITVRVSDEGGVSVVLLNWNGVNETMYMIADGIWSVNKTNLTAGNYTYKVYANDTFNNCGVSETRIVTVKLNILDYYRCLDGNCDEVSTQELLKAAYDWMNELAPPGFTEPLTTMQLLQLASEWASA